jgi:pimeloyl-ACP methyl ester carboxylesterase
MFGVPEGYDEREAVQYKMEPAMTEEFWADNDELVDEIVGWRLDSDAPERAREWQAAGVDAFDVSDRLEEVDVPALVLHGERDRVVPVENGRMLADGLGASLETFEEGGSHLFFIERAAGVNDRLHQFLP